MSYTNKDNSTLAFLQAEIEDKLNQLLIVPKRLTNPENLIVKAKEDIEEKIKKYNYRDLDLISTSLNIIDIRVSKEIVARALRFMDTFVKVLKTRGHTIEVRSWGTYILVGNEEFEVSLREKLKRSKEIRPGKYSYDYTPTKILIFKIGRYWNLKEWQDGKLPLEKKLSAILAHLEVVAKQEEEKRKIREKEHAIRLEQERLQREKDALKEQELKKFKMLLKNTKRWQKAQMLRQYISAIEQQRNLATSPIKDLEEWLEWALKKVNWYDPTVNDFDELLNEVDKETLSFKN